LIHNRTFHKNSKNCAQKLNQTQDAPEREYLQPSVGYEVQWLHQTLVTPWLTTLWSIPHA